MGKTVSIGGATYDVFIHLEHENISTCGETTGFLLPLGAKVKTHKVLEYCGGGASNTSVALARLGCDASFLGIVGDDQWGEKLLLNLQTEGVNTQSATVVEGEVSSFSIILSASSGERTILYDPGTNKHLHDVTFDREKVASADWVFLNHIQDVSCVIQDDLIEIFMSDSAPHLTWNPGGGQLEAGLDDANNHKLIGHTDLLVCNEAEALKFTKTDDLKAAIKTLHEAGAKYVCVTAGSKGTTGSDGTTLYHCPIKESANLVDTTGAGDAFGSGATWALLQGLSLPEAIKAGSINASSVVSAYGAQAGLLTKTDIQTQLKESTLEVSEQTL